MLRGKIRTQTLSSYIKENCIKNFLTNALANSTVPCLRSNSNVAIVWTHIERLDVSINLRIGQIGHLRVEETEIRRSRS